MNKKKLLFVIPEFSHGGTNKSLENLLHFIDKEKYDVSIFSLYEDGGRLYKDIFAPYIIKKSTLYYLLHDNRITRKAMGAIMKLSSKINFNWLYKREVDRLQKKHHFDIAIAYQEGIGVKFLSYADNCPFRIVWIHGHCENGVQYGANELYPKFNYIVCVSETAKKSFLNYHPQFTANTVSVYNTLNVESIKRHASEVMELPFQSDVFNIISVGRFSFIKQFEKIPGLASRIKQITSKPFCWYIIASGSEKYMETKGAIDHYDVGDCVKILNAQDNPYPFFKKANLYVCTSISESFSYTIAESKLLGTPVVCNDMRVAREVVEPYCGIVSNMEKIPETVARLIDNKDNCYQTLKQSILMYRYDNESIIKSFYDILN